MASDIELAKSLFNVADKGDTVQNSYISGSAGGGGNNWSTQGLRESTFASIRYGTVQEVLGNNTYSILLAGSDEPVILGCDTPLKEGQGVRVAIQNGKYLVEGLSYFINENKEFYEKVQKDAEEQRKRLEELEKNSKDWSEEIEKKGKEITEEVREALEGVEAEFNSKIEQTDDRISTEVESLKQADEGVYERSASYTDQKVDGITQTVVDEVMNQAGDTFVSQTDFKQASDHFEASITEAIETAEDGKKVATNFLYYDNDGLVLGGSTGEPVSKNPKGISARLTNSALQFRGPRLENEPGTDPAVWASFGINDFYIGRQESKIGGTFQATPIPSTTSLHGSSNGLDVNYHMRLSTGYTLAPVSLTSIRPGEIILGPDPIQNDYTLIQKSIPNNMLLTGTGMYLRENTTNVAQFTPTAITLGKTNEYHSIFTAGGLDFRNSSDVSVSEFNSSGARIGTSSKGDKRIEITPAQGLTVRYMNPYITSYLADQAVLNVNASLNNTTNECDGVIEGQAGTLRMRCGYYDGGSQISLDRWGQLSSSHGVWGEGATLGYLMSASVLYENSNGSTGTITLRNPSTNSLAYAYDYSILAIEWHPGGTVRNQITWVVDPGNHTTIKTPPASSTTRQGNKYVAGSTLTIGGYNLYVHAQWFRINSAYIYRDTDHTGYFQANYPNIVGLDMGTDIYITKVIGFA